MNKCRYLQSSHFGKLDIHLKAVTKACDLFGALPVSITIQTFLKPTHSLFSLLTSAESIQSHFDVLKLPTPIQNHLITKLAIPLKNDIKFTGGNRGFHIRGWLNRGCKPRARMRKADCVPSTPLFFVRDLSVHGFSYPF